MPKKDTQNKAWAEDKNKFGLKMLEKMGWKGKGLGKNEDGLEQHVKVSKRSANLGLGTEDTGSNNDRIDAFAGQRSWARTNTIIQRLNICVRVHSISDSVLAFS